MPTYDYECDACGHEFELFQSISEAVKKKCPECGKQKLRRLFGTGAAIVFKGSGFYETDYRSDSYKKAAEKDKKGSESKSSESSSSDSKSSDSKSSESKVSGSKGDAKPARKAADPKPKSGGSSKGKA
jgi:putative FmdB family regulatory protein